MRFDRISDEVSHDTFSTEAIRGIHANNELSRMYFSQQNIDALQIGIHNTVLNKSCGKHYIGKQSEDEIKIIMRSIYLEHSLNLMFDPIPQIVALNAKVIEYATNRILKEIDVHATYMHDQSVIRTPIDRGVSTNLAGTKSLAFKLF
jgi:hypothetical protein